MTHISLKIFAVYIWLDPNSISQHSCHQIFPKYDNLLVEEFDATWI